MKVSLSFEEEPFWHAAGWEKRQYYDRLQIRAAFAGKSFIEVPDEDYAEALRIANAIKARDESMSRVVGRNNFARDLEREGRVDAAVALYELNLEEQFCAIFSFERLMVIYRKRKEYTQEIRVIEKAIAVFTVENMRRALHTIKYYPDRKEEILDAARRAESVFDDENRRCIYGAYTDIHKWQQRLEKAKTLLEKMQRAT